MKKSAPVPPPSFILPSFSDPVLEICAKPLSEFNTICSEGTDFFHSCTPLYRDHEKFGKSTARFSQTFTKINHPVSKQAFFGKVLHIKFIWI